jgi:3-oxoadipate enol-lactonase
MTDLHTANGVFNVLVEGDGDAPVLMLSNSLGTNLHMWDRQMPDLLKEFRVLRYDARGHGKSVATAGPYSLEGLSRDALGIMDALALEKVHWMGLSMGGMVGQWLLTHARERIGRAVLANTAANMAAPDIWNSRIETVLSKGMEAITLGVVERWFTKGFIDAHPEAIEPIVQMLHTTPPEGYAGCCAAIRDMDQREAIRSVKAPVLVVVGRHDPSTPPGMGALIASAIEGAKLVTLEAAHLSNIEDPEAYTDAVMTFLTATAPVVRKPAVAPAAPRRVSVRRRPPKVPPAKAPARAIPPQPVAKSAAKPAAPAKAPAKKAPRKSAKKSTARRAIAKPAPRKTSPKKATAKKATVKKAKVRKAMAKKTTAKKAAVKKAPAKKAAKKAVAKKVLPKKMPARKPAPRRAAPGKTRGRKGRR